MLGSKEIYFFMPRKSPFAIVLSKDERVALEAQATESARLTVIEHRGRLATLALPFPLLNSLAP
jgi:hypothetical protein